jgi:hypothetical protein
MSPENAPQAIRGVLGADQRAVAATTTTSTSPPTPAVDHAAVGILVGPGAFMIPIPA